MYSKEIAGINPGFLFNSMIKYQLKYVLFLFILTLPFFPEGKAQLIITGLIEDLERGGKTSSLKNAQSKIAASSYTDTLRLPFFEDFTDPVMQVDSIMIDNSVDSIVRVYDNTLNNYPDGTPIYIGFWSAAANATTTKLSKTLWHIKKISPNVFTIDSTAAMNNPMKIDANTVLKDAFWRFSTRTYSTELDTLKWVSGGNSYINNRYPSEPVSYHVATFDGLNSDGVPYSTNPLAKGFSDHLTSLPINIKSYAPSDNIYLSYYWQHSGISDAPEADDYLRLEFKDSTGTWNVIQTITGNLANMSNFKVNLAPVLDPIYFSKHFQFRFRSYGRLSGPFDIWNVDNIYLNRNRSAADTLLDDKAIGNVPVTFLTNYTAMPYNQYFADKAANSGDMNFNNSNLGAGVVSRHFYYTIADYTVMPDSVLFSRDTSALHHPTDTIPRDVQRTFYDVCTPDINLLTTYTHPIYIDQTFRSTAIDTNNILFTHNNRYATRTILWDYYSYDDGSPEWAVGANQPGAKFANMYTVLLSDTLTDIDIYFTRSKGPNMNGRTILLSVWDQNKTLVSQQTAQVAYGGFKRYTLNSPVIIPAGADYYVGYQQNFGDLLSVGLDKNYDHSEKIVFSLSSNVWNVYNQQPGYVTGSMMIRPVFNKNEPLVLSVDKEEEETLNATLFPVPANDILNIQGKIGEITLYDFTGRKVSSKSFNPMEEDKSINTSHLSNGFYIAELKLNDQVLIKKLIIQH
jgi:hypothetical protein